MKWYTIPWVKVAFLYTLILVILLWPLVTHLNSYQLPYYYENISHSDAQLHTGQILKAKEMISRGNLPVVIDDFDVSQNYIFAGVILTTFGMPMLVYHNLFFLFTVLLGGFFTYLLAKEFIKKEMPALLAGFFYLVSFYALHAYYWGHANTIQTQWIPLIFLLVERLLRYTQKRDALLLGIVLILQVTSNAQYSVYLSFLLPLYLVLRHVLVKHIPFKKIRKNALISASIAGVALLPYVIIRSLVPTVTRTLEENTQVYWRILNFQPLLEYNHFVYMGALQLGLILGGLFLVKKHREYMPFALIFVFTLFCLIGPTHWYMPYSWLYHGWPLVNHFRVPLRMVPFMLMAGALLASLAASKLPKYSVVILLILALIIRLSMSDLVAKVHLVPLY